MSAAFDLAAQGQCVGVDLWNRGPQGQSLRSAVDFLLVRRWRKNAWPYPELDNQTEELMEVLRRAAWQWHSPRLCARRGAVRTVATPNSRSIC